MRTKYGNGFRVTVTLTSSASARSKTVPTSGSVVSRACSTRGTCPIGPVSSSPCHQWFRKPKTEAKIRGQCTHSKMIAVKNFAVSDTRRKFSKSVTTTTRSRGYFNDEQRQMAPENYSSSGEMILQN